MLLISIKILGSNASLFLIDFKKSPPPWTSVHTFIVQDIKKYVKTLSCLGIPTINSFKIVETDASDIGYGGILKQKISPDSPEQIVRFHSNV